MLFQLSEFFEFKDDPSKAYILQENLRPIDPSKLNIDPTDYPWNAGMFSINKVWIDMLTTIVDSSQKQNFDIDRFLKSRRESFVKNAEVDEYERNFYEKAIKLTDEILARKPERWKMITDLVAGVRHLNSIGISYKDAAVRNFMVDSKGNFKLIDIGLSKGSSEPSEKLERRRQLRLQRH